jgi:virulence-associated protein VapD
MDTHSHCKRKATHTTIYRSNHGRCKGAHAQVYQDKASREAQNADMLIQCLKASNSRTVYNKVYSQMDKYTIHRKNMFEPIQDGVCFLKAIIDNYHSNTRSSTKQIRKQLATLNFYMKNIAKGDVMKLVSTPDS